MKTAQEWQDVFWTFPTDKAYIEAIQQDAYKAGLIRAAHVCRACGGNHRDSTIAYNVQICANAVELEAQKGLP